LVLLIRQLSVGALILFFLVCCVSPLSILVATQEEFLLIMQRTTFSNRPSLYSSLSFTVLLTALGVTLIAFLSTSLAFAKELETAPQASIVAYQQKQMLLSSSSVASTPSQTLSTQVATNVVGGAAASQEVEGSQPKSRPFSFLNHSRVPSASSIKEDTILSPFESSKTATLGTKSLNKASEESADSAQSTPSSLSKEATEKTLSQLVGDRELQRQRAVVQFLTARPSAVEVVTAKNRLMVLRSVDFKATKRASFYVNQTEVFQFRSSLGFLTPFLRSKQAAHRLQLFVKNNGNYNDIQVVSSDAGVLLKMGETTIATVDVETAQSLGLSVDALADTWKQKLRSALGETTASATPQWVKKPIQQSGRYLAQGLASWYGPGFHGRLAADGSRFNQNAMTAAHKTLPFGTKLLVTNQRTGQSCVVKVTDRGPFVGHRVIDLSKGAAAAVGMLGSGVAKVSLQILR
jgi:Lytic transglycolase